MVRVTNMFPVIAPIRNGIRTGSALLKVAISSGMGVCSSQVTSLNQNRLCLLLEGAHAKSKHFRPLESAYFFHM